MEAIETTAHFDEEGKFKLDTDQENEDWFGFSIDSLSRTCFIDEPEYPLSLVKIL